MKIALIGGNGQLGSDIIRANEEYNHELIMLNHKDIEITDFQNSFERLRDIHPDVIINTVAYHLVDDCENNPDEAFRVNTLGTRNLGIMSNELKARIVHISTDYVFDGRKEDRKEGYSEFDNTHPVNIYGMSKLRGEELLRSVTDSFYIVRTSWLFGGASIEKARSNFVTTMLKLVQDRDEIEVVNDQFGSPSNSYFVAKQIFEIVKHPYYGIYHAACQGITSWYDLALEIFKIAKKPVKVKPINSSQFLRPAERPQFSALKNYVLKLQDMDIMPHWKDALAVYLGEIL